MSSAPVPPLTQIARNYLAAIERGAPFAELAEFYDPECVQEEFPNRFVPNGARRTLADLEAAAARGKKAVEGSATRCCTRWSRGTRWRSRCSGARGS